MVNKSVGQEAAEVCCLCRGEQKRGDLFSAVLRYSAVALTSRSPNTRGDHTNKLIVPYCARAASKPMVANHTKRRITRSTFVNSEAFDNTLVFSMRALFRAHCSWTVSALDNIVSIVSQHSAVLQW